MLDPSMFPELVVLFGSATLVATLCHALRLPTIVGFLITGAVIGPYSLGLVSSLPNADSLAEIAAVFLMFTIGLEFSFKRLLKARRELIGLGVLQVLVTIMAVALAARLAVGADLKKGVFYGFLVALSSTALVLKLLSDARDLETPYGQGSLSVLLAQDLAVIPMMLALTLLAGQQLTPLGSLKALDAWAIARTGGLLLAVPLGLWVMTRYVVPTVIELVAATRSREVFYFSVLFFCLGAAWLFHLGGLSLALGAFAAGLIVAESPYARQVAADVVPLRDNFLGLFFVSVGMLLDLSFVTEHLVGILALTGLVLALKAALIVPVALVNRLPLSVGAMMGLMMAQIGEFSIILAARGVDLGILGRVEHQWFLAVTVLTLTATPFLYRAAPFLALRTKKAGWKTAAATAEGDAVRRTVIKAGSGGDAHALIIGFGLSGQHVGAALDALKIPWQVVELNYRAVKGLLRRGVNVHFGDATRVEVLEHAGLATAKLVVVAVTGPSIVPAIISAVRAIRPDVQIIVRAQYVRDVEAIQKEPFTDIVVAEIETATELLARALRVYGVPAEDIRRYMEQARTQLATHARVGSTLKSPNLALPSWEALASIRPLRIASTFEAVGKSLAELQLPRKTGSSVVSVFRDGLGTTIPDGTFVFARGDIVHLIGAPEALAAAEEALKGAAGGGGKSGKGTS